MEKNITQLSPVARMKLETIEDLSLEERGQMRDIENLNAVLSVFFKGIMDGNNLFSVLKEAQDQGKQYVLKEARGKLEGSFMESKLPFKFNEGIDGIISVDLFDSEEAMQEKRSTVIEVNAQNFEDTVKNNPRLVVDCWAPWCGPCRMMSPVIDELAADNEGKITFAKLNTDENQEVAIKYQIQAIPTLLIFRDGKLADRKTGAMPKKTLQAELDTNFA